MMTTDSAVSSSSQTASGNTSLGPLADIVLGIFKSRQGIIPRMLSPKHSLLNMCLLRGKYSQAGQVVKVRSATLEN